MKKQLQHIKNFVQDIKDINLNARDKTEILSTELQIAEKKLELIKQVCISTEKKISACLQLLPSGHLNNNNLTERNLNNVNSLMNNSLNGSINLNNEDYLMENLFEKKQKKVPEVQLHQCLQDLSGMFDHESILGITLIESSELQKQLNIEILRYEQDVERLCLSPLNEIIENDIPAVLKSRKILGKVTQEVETLKQKLNQANKANQQSNQNHQQTKVDLLKKELEDVTVKLIQTRNQFAVDLYNFLRRETEFSCIYLQLFKLKANYHKNVLDIIKQNMPRLENIILNNNLKPVFGTSLIEYAEQTNRDLSIVLEYCLSMLNENLNEEGLFRIPGSSSKVKKLKLFFNYQTYQLNQNNINIQNSNKTFYANNLENYENIYEEYLNDPHSVAGCLKSFFRDLPEPLFTFYLYNDLIKCANLQKINDRLINLWKIINLMSKPHFMNLRYLFKFLAKLAANSEINKMNSQNIAIAIAPSLIWSSAQDLNNSNQLSLNMCSANQYGIIIETLINYADWFFPGEIDFSILKIIKKNNDINLRKPSEKQIKNQEINQLQLKSNQINLNSKNKIILSPNFTDKNPIPTPRMSTRVKKPPAPLAPILTTPIITTNNINNSNRMDNFIINNSPNSSNLSSITIITTTTITTTTKPKITTTTTTTTTTTITTSTTSTTKTTNMPILKTFEHKKCNDEQKNTLFMNSNHKINSNTSSSSNSQDSMNNLNEEQNYVYNKINKCKNKTKIKSSECLLNSNNHDNYQNIQKHNSNLCSSSNEILESKKNFTNQNQSSKVSCIYKEKNSRFIGGSLDRRFKINNSNNHILTNKLINKDRSQFFIVERPNKPPPEKPSKINSILIKSISKPRLISKSTDNLLSNESEIQLNCFQKKTKNNFLINPCLNSQNQPSNNLINNNNIQENVNNVLNYKLINETQKNYLPEKLFNVLPNQLLEHSLNETVNVEKNKPPPRPSPPVIKHRSTTNELTYL